MTSPQIDIYTSMFCSYSALAKRLLKSRGVSFNEIDVSDSKDRRSEMLARAEGRRTVSQIFIDDIGIGGYDELYSLEKKGALDTLLAGSEQ